MIKTKKEKKKKNLSLKSKIIITVIYIIFLYILFFRIFSFSWIRSESMENTLKKWDFVFGNRLEYLNKDPERMDIVAFVYPVDGKSKVCKRIIGLPGETIDIKNGKIYINGSKDPLEEDYLAEEWTRYNDGYHFVVPEDSYFMMGDNRNISYDSRFWNDAAMKENKDITPEEAESYRFVKRSSIITKLTFRIFPFTKIGGL